MRVGGVLFGISAILASAMIAVPAACAELVLDLDLPSAPLADSLMAVGSKAHVNIVFSPDGVAGKRSAALKGAFSLPAALRELLAGSGLDYTNTRAGTYIIVAARPSPVIVSRPPVAESPTRLVRVIPPQAPRTVVVTGYRNGLSQALKLKRDFSGVVDSLVAEDIAKFPDNNVAEAILRVPGVAIARDQGEGRSISVRGLGGEFTRTEINGIEAQAASDGPTQGVNKGRGFDFNVFPSDLFSRIDVKKTSSADQPEGSLGATVGLVTPRPFDRKGLKFAAALQTNYNDLSERSGAKASWLFSNTYDAERIGLLVSLSYAETPLEMQGVHSGGWNQGTANGGFCKPTTGTGGLCDVPAADLAASLAAYDLANQATAYSPQFYRYSAMTGNVRRLGFTGSFQWRPSEKSLITVDLLHSRFTTHRDEHYLEGIGFSRGASQGGKPEIVPRRVVLDANNTMIYGLFDNVDVRSEMTIDDSSTDFTQGSLQLRQQLTRKLSFEGLLGHSISRFDNAREITAQMDRFNVDGYAFDLRGGGQTRPSILYNFDVTDPANWYFGPLVTQPGGSGASGPELRVRPNYTRNGYETAKAKLIYGDTDDFRASLGLELKRYIYESISYRFDFGEADFPSPTVNLPSLTQVFCGLSKIAPPEGTPTCWLEPNVAAFVQAYNLLANEGRTALSTTNVAARGRNQAVTENDRSIFAQIYFRRKVFGWPIQGDIGVRHVRTHQQAYFYTNVPTPAEPDGFAQTQVERTYDDFLPSLNLALETGENTILRFSAARVMARPPLSYIAAATSVTVNGAKRQVITGNPNLEPFRAISYDLSYEFYPSSGSLATVGVFYKDISTYVQSLTTLAPYSTTGLPESLLAYTGVTVADDFSISNIVNTPGGILKGFEINYQNRFKSLPGLWSGLGVIFHYTYVDSKIKYNTTTPAGPKIVGADLLNLSRNSYVSTLYYEKGAFQARVSTNFRSRYLTSIPGAFNADAAGVDGATYWDASMGYRLRPGLLLTFEAQNLTNERSVTWDNSDLHLVAAYQASGRQYNLGLRYTY